MSTLIRFALVAALALPLMASAQDDQTAKATAIGDGPFTAYAISPDGDTYKITGCCADVWQFTSTEYHGDFKAINAQEFESKDGLSYYPDEEAFPVTYVRGYYVGSPDLIEKYDHVERTPTDRIVILDGWVYVLEDYNSKDDYVIRTVLAPGEIKGLKAVKATFAAAKKNEGPLRQEELQAYLDAGFAKQAELLPAWQSANKDLIATRTHNATAVYQAMEDFNEEYKKTPEYLAMLENRARAERAASGAAPSRVTLVNDTGETVGIMHSGGTNYINVGSSRDVSCGLGEVFYAHDDKGWKKDRRLFDTEDFPCGSSVSLSKY